MRIGVIQFPGSNCERETMMALERSGMVPVECLWNEAEEKLVTLDGYVIVGGFSYEDRSRAGIIAALDPIMQVIKQQSDKGKPVLGICNGAQILVETGLVPGLENHKVAMALTENKRVVNGKVQGSGYYNQWIHMRLSDHYQRNAFTRHLTPKAILRVPIAHAEGRFVMPPALYNEIIHHGLHVFQYCDDKGAILDHFPINPNGSIGNIAAVSNKTGNVLAMMPHPERTDIGGAIFLSMRDYIAAQHYTELTPLGFYPRQIAPVSYQKEVHSTEYLIESLITDNHALTVENTLKQLGMDVTVQRQVHWEINCINTETIENIMQSGELFNSRKELVVERPTASTQTLSFLVRAKEDMYGLQKKQILEDHYALTGINSIRHGVVWHFTTSGTNAAALKTAILQTNIMQNPYAHDYYQYN